MQKKTFKESLPCLLTDQEKIEKGLALSGLLSEINSLEVQKKAMADRFKKEIEGKSLEVSDISQIISDGFEQRMVECIEERDYEKMMIHIIRTDCGVIVRSRAMTLDERQEPMFDEQVEAETYTVVDEDEDRHMGHIAYLGDGR
jgi:hypothetical protein